MFVGGVTLELLASSTTKELASDHRLVGPALVVWLLAIAPWAVDILAQGGDNPRVFQNGFIQAIVLGPLIGLSQATALRDHTRGWMWWFAANLTTCVLGAAACEFGKWVLGVVSLSTQIHRVCSLLGFLSTGCGCCG